MNFTIHDVLQRSPEWYALRVGLLTGSCANAVIAERKRGTGELAIRKSLRQRLVCERITGLSADDTFQSVEMQRGLDIEPAALDAYEAMTGNLVQSVGFVSHNTLKAGCSPDGYVNDWEGVIELKAPKSPTHLEYLQAGGLPEDYRGQIIHALWLTGAAWCDFCSFDPRFPVGLELFRVRVRREDVDLASYELACRFFLDECEAAVSAVLKLGEASNVPCVSGA